MYALGGEYGVLGLKELCLPRFASLITRAAIDSDDLATGTHIAYNELPKDDDKLR